MEKFLALYRVTNKCAQTEEGKKFSNVIGFVIMGIIAVALLGVGGYYSGLFAPAISMLMPGVDVSNNLFTLVFWISGIMILFTGLPVLLGTMFMSSDVDVLAAMPISGSTIALTRVMAAVPISYITTAGVILPFTIGYMVSTGFDAMLLLLAIVGVLIIPVGSLSIIAIVLTVIMKLFRQVRNRDMLTVLGSVAAILVIIVINVISNGAADAAFSENQAMGILSTLVGISDIAWSLPFAACLGKAIAGGFLYLVGAIVIAAVLFAVLYLVLSKMYLSAALGMANARSSSKVLNNEQLERGSASRSINRALFLKEVKSYFKETKYIQSWVFAVLMPVLLLILAMFGSKDGGAPAGFPTALIDASALPVAYSIFVGVAMAMANIGLAACMSSAATSSISREGESFDFMKTCPVEYRVQVNAKRKVAMIPIAAGAVIYEVCCVIVAAMNGVLAIPALIAALVTDVFGVVLLTNLQMFTAARKANVHWMNVQSVVKQMGLWVIIGFMVFFVFTVPALLVAPLGELLEGMNATLWVYVGAAALVVVVALAAFLTTKPCLRRAAEKLEQLS